MCFEQYRFFQEYKIVLFRKSVNTNHIKREKSYDNDQYRKKLKIFSQKNLSVNIISNNNKIQPDSNMPGQVIRKCNVKRTLFFYFCFG